jgi:putative transposase
LFIEGQPHHVIQRGNNRTAMFGCDEDFLFFEVCFGKAIEDCGVAVHAIVLMTNHVHIVATPATPQSLPKAMQSLGRRYVQRFNRSHNRTGTLWEGRYRSTVINSVRHLLTCMCYVERNPVRARLVARPQDYRWSSFRANALGGDCGVSLTPHPIYLELGSTDEARQAAYRDLFRREIPLEDVEAIRHATNRAWLLGHPEASSVRQPGSDSDLTPLLSEGEGV